jgi:transmembrane sensor
VHESAGREVAVTVVRGKVEVGDDTRTYSQVMPNQQIVVNTTNHHFALVKTDTEKATHWKEQFFILDAVTMEEAAARIGERFHTRVIIQNNDLKRCRVSGTFIQGEDLNHVIAVLSSMSGAGFTITPTAVTLSGGSCQ